jgi:hypothetical protein
MIAKLYSNISSQATLAYNSKDESQIIHINNLQGDCYEDFNLQILARQQLFTGHARNLTAHIILSPSPADAEKLTRLQWKKISTLFLKKAGMDHLQSVVFLHLKEPNHLHIVVNRIDKTGSIFRGSKHELAMSQRLGDEIALELGLVRASRVRFAKRTKEESTILGQHALAGSELQRELIKAESAWRDEFSEIKSTEYFQKFRSRKNEEETFSNLPKEDLSEEGISGITVQHGVDRFVHPSLSGNRFNDSQLVTSEVVESDSRAEKTKLLLEKIRLEFEEYLAKMKESHAEFKRKEYFSDLRKRGYRLVEFRKQKTGVLFGYGVEKDGFRFSASEIGSDYTLTNLRRSGRKERIQTSKPVTIPVEVEQNALYSYNQENGKEEGSVSQELTRAISQQMLKRSLTKIASDGPFESFFDFVEAIKNRGYVIDLRKKEEEILGYTIYMETEHFQDSEIGEGQFTIDQLLLRGVLRNVYRRTYSQNATTTEIEKTSGDVVRKLPWVINEFDQLDAQLAMQQTPRQRPMGLEDIRRKVVKELFDVIDTIVVKDKYFSVDRFFETAAERRFLFDGIADSWLGSDYTIYKYGYSFCAGELHKDLTMDKLKKRMFDTSRSSNQYNQRSISNEPPLDLDQGSGVSYSR